MTHHLILIELKLTQLELRGHNHVWLGPNSCKCTLSLIFFFISFNLVVQLRLMNCRFDCYEFSNHEVKNYSSSL